MARSRRMTRWQANLIFLSMAVFWGLGFPLTKEGLVSMSPLAFLFGRFAIAAVLLFLLNPRSVFFTRPSEWMIGILLGLCLSLAYITQTVGLATTSSGKTGFITSLNIVFVPLLSSLVFKKFVSIKDRVAIGFALLGFSLISLRSVSGGISTGDLWILICAILFAVQIVLIDQFTKDVNAYRVNFIQILTGTLVCGGGVLLFEGGDLGEYQKVWWPLLITGVFAVAYPFVAQIYAQRATTPTAAALLMSLEAVFAVLFGWMWHQEILSFQEYVGCLVIFMATLLLLKPERNAPSLSASGASAANLQ